MPTNDIYERNMMTAIYEKYRSDVKLLEGICRAFRRNGAVAVLAKKKKKGDRKQTQQCAIFECKDWLDRVTTRSCRCLRDIEVQIRNLLSPYAPRLLGESGCISRRCMTSFKFQALCSRRHGP